MSGWVMYYVIYDCSTSCLDGSRIVLFMIVPHHVWVGHIVIFMIVPHNVWIGHVL